MHESKTQAFLENVIVRHKIDQLVTNDEWVCAKIQKGMTGLRQAAMLAYQHLKNYLKPFGCAPIPGTTGMWKHDARKTKFYLYVDDLEQNTGLKMMPTICVIQWEIFLDTL